MEQMPVTVQSEALQNNSLTETHLSPVLTSSPYTYTLDSNVAK